MKRTSRQMSPEQRAKISATLTGRKQSEITKKRIGDSMKKYWSTIPPYPKNNDVNPIEYGKEN
jgi:hypothetical protein